MKPVFFTFGQNHVHVVGGITFDCNCVLQIIAPDPRQFMFAMFGRQWSMQYETKPTMEFYPRGIFTLTLKETE